MLVNVEETLIVVESVPVEESVLFPLSLPFPLLLLKDEVVLFDPPSDELLEPGDADCGVPSYDDWSASADVITSRDRFGTRP